MSPRPIGFLPREFALPAGAPSDNLTAAFRHLLISGSDNRLHIDATRQLNSYGCRPFPRPDAITFSSSTASSISARGYAAAERAFAALCEAGAASNFENAFATLCQRTRCEIAALFELDDTAVVLSPSGTDSAMQALLLARAVLGGPVTSIVVGADETGSGVGLAASGRHFNPLASAGTVVDKGETVAGLDDIASIAITAQDHNGARSLAVIDAAVHAAVAQALAAGRRVALYAMDHSKIGARYPSAACIDEILSHHGSAVQVIVDACQARLSRRRLRTMLDRGFMVLITGSKFFTGPPLSGALLMPAALCAVAKHIGEVPDGLAAYSASYDWPDALGEIGNALPARATIGQLLRWTAALAEMRDYFAVPELVRRIMIAEFGNNVARAIAGYSDFELLAEPEWLATTEDNGEFGVRTIFPFVMRRKGRPLSMAEARLVHQALNEDVSALLPQRARDVAARLCHVGEPVEIADGQGGTTGALRISADARLVSESWAGDGMVAAMDRLRLHCRQIVVTFEKGRLLVGEIDRLRAHLAQAQR
jgi:hypothetical protein